MKASATLVKRLHQAGVAVARPPKPSKYRNKVVVIDGERFDSLAEATRYEHLKLMQRAGEITDLERQVVYPLTVNGVKVGKIIPDFRYRLKDGTLVVEDTKSPASITPLFRWKAKHLFLEYGITVRIVS